MSANTYWGQWYPALYSAGYITANPATIERDHQRFLQQKPAGLAGALFALENQAFNETANLGRVLAPTLVMAGSLDVVAPPAEQTALAAGIPGAKLVFINGSGHLTSEEKPTEFNAIIDAFLDIDQES